MTVRHYEITQEIRIARAYTYTTYASKARQAKIELVQTRFKLLSNVDGFNWTLRREIELTAVATRKRVKSHENSEEGKSDLQTRKVTFELEFKLCYCFLQTFTSAATVPI